MELDIIRQTDEQIANLIEKELDRQRNTLELIAIIVAIKGINEIYSNFKIGIILRKKFGYYH